MNGDEVADRAKAYARDGVYFGVGVSLKFARLCAGAPGGVQTAFIAWQKAQHKHETGVPPRGTFVFWSGGSKGYGTVGVSDGGGYVWHPDVLHQGKVDRISIHGMAAHGRLTYLGWTTDINGVEIEA